MTSAESWGRGLSQQPASPKRGAEDTLHGCWRGSQPAINNAPDAEQQQCIRCYDSMLHEGPCMTVADYERELNAARAEIERLKRGEFICQRCFLRKDADKVEADF